MKKYINIKIYFLLSLLCSCSQESELRKVNANFMILDPKGSARLKDIGPVPWAVGPDLRQKVTKGVRMVVNFPKVDESDWRVILKKTGADSWLIKVSRQTLTEERTLGLIAYPLFPATRKNFSIDDIRRPPEGATFNIFYADASPSLRFERMSCPAFGTHKVLDDVFIEDESNEGRDKMSFSASDESRINDQVLDFNFYTMVLNGGSLLTGKYEIYLALYKKSQKRKVSSWIKLPQVGKVEGEMDKAIKGCNDFKVPARKKQRTLEGINFQKRHY